MMTTIPVRLSGLDAARGLAVLGMFAAHLGGPAPSFDWSTPASWPAVVDGRSSILFALCAGVSLVLMTVGRRGADPVRDRRRIVCRAIAVFVLGIALECLPNGPSIILPTYAVLFVAAVPFLRLRLRWVVIAALGSLCIGPVLCVIAIAVVPARPGVFATTLFAGYPAVSWFGVVLVGVLLARVGLVRRRVQLRALAGGVVAGAIGYGGGIALTGALGLQRDEAMPGVVTTPPTGGAVTSGSADSVPVDWAALVDVTPHAGSTFELLGATGVAVTVLALFYMVGARAPGALWPLAAVGRIALTLYAGHVIAMSAWAAAGSPGRELLGGWASLLVLVAIAFVVAAVFARLRRRGPLERLTGWASRRLDAPRSATRAVDGVPDAHRTDDRAGEEQQRHHDHRAVEPTDAHLTAEHDAGERHHHQARDARDRVVHR